MIIMMSIDFDLQDLSRVELFASQYNGVWGPWKRARS